MEYYNDLRTLLASIWILCLNPPPDSPPHTHTHFSESLPQAAERHLLWMFSSPADMYLKSEVLESFREQSNFLCQRWTLGLTESTSFPYKLILKVPEENLLTLKLRLTTLGQGQKFKKNAVLQFNGVRGYFQLSLQKRFRLQLAFTVCLKNDFTHSQPLILIYEYYFLKIH